MSVLFGLIMARAPFFDKQSGTWRVHYEKLDGRRGTKTLGKTKSEAFKAWKAMTTPVANPLVIDIAGQYLDTLEQRLKLKSITQEHFDLIHLSLKQIMNPRLSWDKFTPKFVTDFCLKKDWRASTVSIKMAHYKALSRYGAEQHGLEDNLITLKKPSSVSRDRIPTPEEIEALYDVIFKQKTPKYHRAAILIAVLYHTGARPGELTNTKRSDFKGDQIILTQWKNAKKKKEPRVIYLNKAAQIACEMSEGSKTWLFANADGGQWDRNTFGVRFRRLCQYANIEKGLVPYSFRHGYATRALEAGVDSAHLAALMGTSTKMIEKHYGHLTKRAQFLRTVANSF